MRRARRARTSPRPCTRIHRRQCSRPGCHRRRVRLRRECSRRRRRHRDRRHQTPRPRLHRTSVLPRRRTHRRHCRPRRRAATRRRLRRRRSRRESRHQTRRRPTVLARCSGRLRSSRMSRARRPGIRSRRTRDNPGRSGTRLDRRRVLRSCRRSHCPACSRTCRPAGTRCPRGQRHSSGSRWSCTRGSCASCRRKASEPGSRRRPGSRRTGRTSYRTWKAATRSRCRTHRVWARCIGRCFPRLLSSSGPPGSHCAAPARTLAGRGRPARCRPGRSRRRHSSGRSRIRRSPGPRGTVARAGCRVWCSSPCIHCMPRPAVRRSDRTGAPGWGNSARRPRCNRRRCGSSARRAA